MFGRKHLPVEDIPQKLTCDHRGCAINPGDSYYATNEDDPLHICMDCAADYAFAQFLACTTLKTARVREDV